jgi:hypothetical protein
MKRFRVKKDWIYEVDFLDIKEVMYKKGHIFDPNEEGKYILKLNDITKEFDYEGMKIMEKEMDIFYEINEDIKVEVSEIGEDDLEEIKYWRLQLDLKTSYSKMKKIEKFLNDELYKFFE